MPLGARRGSPATDVYAERANADLNVWNAELVPPATSYAATRSPLVSANPQWGKTVGPKTNAFFGNWHWRMKGLLYSWIWGGANRAKPVAWWPSSDASVASSSFQPVQVQLYDYSQNLAWFQAGWNGTGSGMFQGSNPIRAAYPSIRVDQLQFNTMGAPGAIGQVMRPRPRFSAVQTVPKYTASPRRYNTTSAPSGRSNGIGRSSSRWQTGL